MPTPFVSVGTFKQHKGGSPWSAQLSVHAPGRPAKRTALGLFWEARRESEQLQEGYSEHSETQARPKAAFWKKKSSLQSHQLAGRRARSF